MRPGSWWKRYWFRPEPVLNLAVCRVVVVGSWLWLEYVLNDPRAHIPQYAGLPRGLYDPLPVLHALVWPVGWSYRPGPEVLEIAFWISVVAGCLALLGLLTNASLLTFALGSLFLKSYFDSYGDVHHVAPAIMVALLLLALSPCGRVLSLDSMLRKRRDPAARSRPSVESVRSPYGRWCSLLIAWLLALIYLSAAFSKVNLRNGFEWANGYTLQWYLLQDGLRWDRPLGIWLGQQHVPVFVLSWVTVLFEGTFFLAVLYRFRRLSYLYIAVGIALHLGIYWAMNAPFFTFLALYSVLIPWHRIWGRTRSWLTTVRAPLLCGAPDPSPADLDPSPPRVERSRDTSTGLGARWYGHVRSFTSTVLAALSRPRCLALPLVFLAFAACSSENGAPHGTAASPAASPSLLKVSTANPRYFEDASGRPVYLSGFHTWMNASPRGIFDFDAYLAMLGASNFIRYWYHGDLDHGRWGRSRHIPYQRTGPGNAIDGKPKVDLTKFDQSYFDRLRAHVVAAGEAGKYVSIMFFEGWWMKGDVDGDGQGDGADAWRYRFMNPANNVNRFSSPPTYRNEQTLAVPEVVRFQEAYIRKVIDTVGDLDNVLYEIANESGGTVEWQYHLIDYVKSYEADRPKQHPVGMTMLWGHAEADDELFASEADWISPGGRIWLTAPPEADGSKVIIADTDHFGGSHSGDRTWVWKSFTRGLNPIAMDHITALTESPWGDYARAPEIRDALAHTQGYARRLDLRRVRPRSGLCSTAYCLADPGKQYLVYQPGAGPFTVDLVAGRYRVEWFDTVSGSVVEEGTVSASGGKRTFPPPTPHGVLFLEAVGSGSP